MVPPLAPGTGGAPRAAGRGGGAAPPRLPDRGLGTGGFVFVFVFVFEIGERGDKIAEEGLMGGKLFTELILFGGGAGFSLCGLVGEEAVIDGSTGDGTSDVGVCKGKGELGPRKK